MKDDGQFRELLHGTTRHGLQELSERSSCRPASYLHPTSPLSEAFAVIERLEPLTKIGVIGLGSGALSCYAEPNQEWTFFEIDRAVDNIARRRFTFLQNSPAGKINVVLGDARIRLQNQKDGSLDLLVLDAFSSDSIPVHLLTHEAFSLYRAKTTSGGSLILHISNRYLDLAPVVGRLGAALGLSAFFKADSPDPSIPQKDPSQCAVLTPSPAVASALTEKGWTKLEASAGAAPWSDDYSNLISVLRFGS